MRHTVGSGQGRVMNERVRLIQCTDKHTTIKPGALGTVRLIDAQGTVHVDWDDGRKLGLIPGEDRWEPIVDEHHGRRGACR